MRPASLLIVQPAKIGNSNYYYFAKRLYRRAEQRSIAWLIHYERICGMICEGSRRLLLRSNSREEWQSPAYTNCTGGAGIKGE
jgi:hypothetical protein